MLCYGSVRYVIGVNVPLQGGCIHVHYVVDLQQRKGKMQLTREEHQEEAERWLLKAQSANDDKNVPYQKMQVWLKFAEIHAMLAQ